MPSPTRSTPKPDSAVDDAEPKQRRKYNSLLRKQQSAETRDRIITAGSELVHNFTSWDWTNLTARAVGERAGVSERTVHRYFSTERKLRDAVLQRIVEESGVDLSSLSLGEFKGTVEQLFSFLPSFATEPTTINTSDPSLESIDKLRRDALLKAVADATPDWSDNNRETAAAVLDMFWNMPPFERLTLAWGFEPERAVSTITWMVGLVQDAIKENRLPEPNS